MDETILNLIKTATWLSIAQRNRMDEDRMSEAIASVCVAVDAVLERADELLDFPEFSGPQRNR